MTETPEPETFIIKETPTERLHEILKVWEPLYGGSTSTRDRFLKIRIGAVKHTLRERGESI